MNWRERLGFGEKEKETFDRGYCTEYTIDNYTPVMTGWEKSIGLRYLKDDVYIDGVIRSRRLNNAFGEEKAKLKKLGKRGLSQDVLSFYIQQEEISRWNFGKSIVEKARDLELIEILTPRQAKERFENFPFDKVGNPSGGTSVFKKSGWRIFTDEKDRFVDYEEKKVYLLSPKLNMGKQFVFDVVSLDDLYEKDPEFIPEKIVEYETARNLSELASEIKFNYKIHEISPEEILPDFVLEVGKITNPKKRKAEIESMCAFGDRVSELDNDGKYDVNLISNSLFYQKVDMGDGKDLLVSDYLYHMGLSPN